METVIKLDKIVKNYKVGTQIVRALRSVSLTIYKGEYVAIMGASGSGKSTMMNIIGCLDAPTSGTYFLDGIRTAELDEYQQAQIRNRKIGFVFQNFNLISRTKAVDNVAMPLAYAAIGRQVRHTRALAVLDAVGLS